MNPFGTRVIQKLIAQLNEKSIHNLKYLIKHLSPIVNDLLNDVNGNHIILKLIQLFPNHSDFIYEEIYNNFIFIATDKQGCSTIQKCYEMANSREKGRITNRILENCTILMTDRYANYVIQYVVAQNDSDFANKLIKCFLPNTNYFAKQKFSSNVIEKVKF